MTRIKLAFALWGFIPPDGGGQYKISLIETIIVDELKGNSTEKSNSRIAVKKAEAKLKNCERDLEQHNTTATQRGSTPVLESKQDDDFAKLMDVMVTGRNELNNQRLLDEDGDEELEVVVVEDDDDDTDDHIGDNSDNSDNEEEEDGKHTLHLFTLDIDSHI